MNQLELLGNIARKLARMFPGFNVAIRWNGDAYEVGVIGREPSPEDFYILPVELAAEELPNDGSFAALDFADNEPAGTRTQNQRIKS